MSFDPEVYRELEHLTGKMADAAEHQDFEQLSALSANYEALSELLGIRSARTAAETASVEDSIRNILSHQQRISQHTGPWLEHVRTLLRENRQEKSLIDAYRTI